MFILSLETSCDETSIALLENRKIIKIITISQILEHEKFGGVVPGLAAKLQVRNIQKILSQFLSTINIKKINYIAYTREPGLIVCLQIGKIVAETLSLYLNKPLISINHLEGHIYASLLETNKQWKFPVLGVIVSGGHTEMYKIDTHCVFKYLGGTLDDAVGECLDKASILMGYEYPGGPTIEKLALNGKESYKLPFPKDDKSFNFSFSGIKSEIRKIVEKEKNKLNVKDLSFTLQSCIAKVLAKKIKKALINQEIKTLVVGGGVISNSFLRNFLLNEFKEKKIKFFIPPKKYCNDNAAMIGINAYYRIKLKFF